MTTVLGFYGPSSKSDGSFVVYFSRDAQLPIKAGTIISGLPGIAGNVTVQTYNSNVYGDVVVNPGPPAISFPYLSNAIVYSDVPNTVNIPSSISRFSVGPLTTANVTTANVTSNFDSRTYNFQGTLDLRELNSNVQTSEGLNTYTTVIDRGAGTGALIALAAIGAQEPYMYGGESKWIPRIVQHTPFAISQRLTTPLVVAGQMLGTTVQVPIPTRDCKDLISNMHLSCTLPALTSGYTYCEMIGRALFSKVQIIIDGVVYETLTDDWYIINDQLFLDADQKLNSYRAYNAGVSENQPISASSPIQLLIPLNLFFCRTRHGFRRSYLPVCALGNSSIIIRFDFHTPSWITNAPSDINGNPIDISNVRLLIEEISLSPSERMYFTSQKHVFKIPQVWPEAVQGFDNGQVRANFTANFPVLMMAWFIRNKRFEQDIQPAPAGLTPPNLSQFRYTYGYTTQYNQSSIPVTFFNGVTIQFIDVIQSATLYINNNNILSNFPGALYYSYKQPIDHGLSVPTKNIYMYSFSKKPKMLEGALDFGSLNSSTSHLDITFKPEYASQITAAYNLHMFYYGYKTVQVSNGKMSYVS